MKLETLVQPEMQLGREIERYLASNENCARIVLISAFVSLRTVLRLRDQLLRHREAGCVIRIIVGVDLGGTSREVLEELLRWHCEVSVFHNASPRATFHPKIYWFETSDQAAIIVGSNNMTEGGFFTNHEAAVRQIFALPQDQQEYEVAIAGFGQLVEPADGLVLPLTADLIHTLSERGVVPSEAAQRAARRRLIQSRSPRDTANMPPNPFSARIPKLPPLLFQSVRVDEPIVSVGDAEPESNGEALDLRGDLLWVKTLPASDALQVNEGSNSVGGVRLTQARFENPAGQRIDQTTYFRNLFSDFDWEPESGQAEKEHAFVSMRVLINDEDYGVQNFEISHKPSGEAGQGNYTTILRWGRQFSPVIKSLQLEGAALRLFENFADGEPFLLKIGA